MLGRSLGGIEIRAGREKRKPHAPRRRASRYCCTYPEHFLRFSTPSRHQSLLATVTSFEPPSNRASSSHVSRYRSIQQDLLLVFPNHSRARPSSANAGTMNQLFRGTIRTARKSTSSGLYRNCFEWPCVRVIRYGERTFGTPVNAAF